MVVAASPFLFTLHTYDCLKVNYVLNFLDDTTYVGRIRDGNKDAYWQDIGNLVGFCRYYNLELKLDKTK